MSGLSHVQPNRLVAAALARSASVLLEKGWARGSYTSLTGAVCAAGAINLTLTGRPEELGSLEASSLPTVTYLTLQATKRALTLAVTPPKDASCTCPSCTPAPARAIMSRHHQQRVSTGHYDGAIARWNDYRCFSAADVVGTLLGIPDRIVEIAVRDEFGVAAPRPVLPVTLPSMRPVSEDSTDRELLAVL